MGRMGDQVDSNGHDLSAESVHMERVDTINWGPSEPDEMDVLRAHLPYDKESGTFQLRFRDDV